MQIKVRLEKQNHKSKLSKSNLIQSLGYAPLHTAIPCQAYDSLGDPDQRTLVYVQENRGLSLTPCAPSRNPKNSFFFSFRSWEEK